METKASSSRHATGAATARDGQVCCRVRLISGDGRRDARICNKEDQRQRMCADSKYGGVTIENNRQRYDRCRERSRRSNGTRTQNAVWSWGFGGRWSEVHRRRRSPVQARPDPRQPLASADARPPAKACVMAPA